MCTYIRYVISLTLLAVVPHMALAQSPQSRVYSGELSVLLIDNFEEAKEQTIFKLSVEGQSQLFELDFISPPGFTLRNGQKIQVNAVENPGQRLKVEKAIMLEAPGNGSGGGSGGSKKGGGNTSVKGPRSSSVVLINLQDGDALLTRDQAEAMMWGPTNSTRDLYLKDSRGAIDFVPDSDNDGLMDVYGPYNVAMNGAGSCAYGTWAKEAQSLAEADGVTFNNRDHKIWVLSANNGCGFGGIAELGGDDAYINFGRPFVFYHELGHNLNLHHAGKDTDNNGSINSAYGDGSSFMGASYRDIGLNAPQAEAMGYFDQSGSVLELASNPGTYTLNLSPLAQDSSSVSHPQIIKIARNDLDLMYYISLRDNTSYDANLASSYKTGVSIHWSRPDNSGTPTGYVTTLSNGESFNDEVNGITVTQNLIAADNSTADITVELLETYDVGQLGLDVRSFASQSRATIGPNETAQFSVALTNNDAAGTPPTTWSLSTRNIDAEMTAQFSDSQVSLAPGESKTVALSIAANGTVDSSAVFYVDAIDADGNSPAHQLEEDYGILVVNSVDIKPEPPTNVTASVYKSKGKQNLQLDWTPSVSADIARYRVLIADEPLARYWQTAYGNSLTRVWTDDLGTYTFTVVAESNNGKLSVLSEPVTVTIPR